MCQQEIFYSNFLHRQLYRRLSLMETKHVLSFIFLQLIINTEVFADEGSSTSSRSVFFVTKENIRLKGHTVKRFESPTLLTCSHLCLRNEWCTSTNFKLSSKNSDEGTCELNKHDISLINQNAVFQEQEDVTFSMSFKVNNTSIMVFNL